MIKIFRPFICLRSLFRRVRCRIVGCSSCNWRQARRLIGSDYEFLHSPDFNTLMDSVPSQKSGPASQMNAYFYPNLRVIRVFYGAGTDKCVSIHCSHCPFCGRRLPVPRLI